MDDKYTMELFYEIGDCLLYAGMILIGMYFFEGESDDLDPFESIEFEPCLTRGKNSMKERKIPLSWKVSKSISKFSKKQVKKFITENVSC